MPFYEYECSNCKFYVEALQKISEAPMRQCPSCKKQTLKRLVSAPNFRLKGGGWYETDFKSEQEAKRNLAVGEEAETKAEAPKESASEGKDSAKAADAKPESAKADKPVAKPTSQTKKPSASKPIARAPAKKAAAKPKPRSRSKAPVRKK
jgi:putative FmdB family regulatory protein